MTLSQGLPMATLRLHFCIFTLMWYCSAPTRLAVSAQRLLEQATFIVEV